VGNHPLNNIKEVINLKVECKVKCTGSGYKNFNVGETREIKKDIAEKLIKFGYVEEVKTTKKKVVKKDDDTSEG
jgi:hypothetical protein